MDISLRHGFTLCGAWRMLLRSPSSTAESEHNQRGEVGALFEPDLEDACANDDFEAGNTTEVGGGVDSDNDNAMSMSDAAERLEFTQASVVDLFPVENRGSRRKLAFTNNHSARTGRLIRTVPMQNVNGWKKKVDSERPRGSLAARVMLFPGRAHEPTANHKKSKHSQEREIEYLRGPCSSDCHRQG